MNGRLAVKPDSIVLNIKGNNLMNGPYLLGFWKQQVCGVSLFLPIN